MTTGCDPGSISRLGDVIGRFDVSSLLLLTGGTSFETSGAARAIDSLRHGIRIERVGPIPANPCDADVDQALDRFASVDPDVVVAVGGGSVIDVAKVVRILGGTAGTSRPFIVGAQELPSSDTPLVAVPTTAGTGAEATHFAVIYVDGHKYSVASPVMRPDEVILDPELTYSLPPSTTAATGLDAICQGIESLWAIDSTPDSREHAIDAVRLGLANIAGAVRSPTPSSRSAMLEAAHLSGRAIDVSKTTAPHAMSYTLTSSFGVPHGNAVALTLGAILEYNAEVTESDCADPRGADHVRAMVQEVVGLVGADDAATARRAFEALVDGIAPVPRLAAIGAPLEDIRSRVISGVNEERLANNPRHMTPDDLRKILDSID